MSIVSFVTSRRMSPREMRRFNVFKNFKRPASTAQETEKSGLRKYMEKVFDNPLPLGVGALVVGLVQWRRIRERNERTGAPLDSGGGGGDVGKVAEVLDDNGYVVTIYKSLPLRHLSRLWGKIHEIHLPVWARNSLLGFYAKVTGCNVSEAEVEDLTSYENLGAFFKRKLKTECRPIDSCSLVSPCDGQVLHLGPVDTSSGYVEQVKGVTYSLSKFLGSYFDGTSPHIIPAISYSHPSHEELESRGNKLYQCVMYLAPGDYHGFHSPVHWNLHQRRHFPGELLSVNPSVVRKMNKVFELNERAVYLGKWEHGFFSMTAVAATMVGGIKVGCDPDLSTNNWRWEDRTFHQKLFQDGIPLKKGDVFGEFNLGSTIVLIFEAPENFTWSLRPGDKVQVGRSLCAEEKSKEGCAAVN